MPETHFGTITTNTCTQELFSQAVNLVELLTLRLTFTFIDDVKKTKGSLR